ncbi:MAG: prepilin-type N-terminal cleavage/methylation domain-containing protein [Phycisphaerae bacterium]|nr:prepilin-type N-terminal cleavage/methylation domain-containing protein [Phycisphaerae bacterium]
MKTPVRKKQSGFTLVEVMLSLVILAVLMTAVAFAFDASVTNYQANKGIYETVNRARQALLRITNDLRSAQAVALIGGGDPDNSQVSLITNTNADITYRYDASSSTLYYDDNTSGNSYVLCNHVTGATFNRTEHEIDRDNGAGGVETITAIRDVRIVLALTDDTGEVSYTLPAATLVRKNQ